MDDFLTSIHDFGISGTEPSLNLCYNFASKEFRGWPDPASLCGTAFGHLSMKCTFGTILAA